MTITKKLLVKLDKIAQHDQTEDESRPWNYTHNCHMCGGVGSFIQWLFDHMEELDGEVQPDGESLV